jgi:hypothetical protein
VDYKPCAGDAVASRKPLSSKRVAVREWEEGGGFQNLQPQAPSQTPRKSALRLREDRFDRAPDQSCVVTRTLARSVVASAVNATCPTRRHHLGDGLAWLLRVGPSSLPPRPPESSPLSFVAIRTHARAREFLVHALQRLVRTVQPDLGAGRTRCQRAVEQRSRSKAMSIARGVRRRIMGRARRTRDRRVAAQPGRDLGEDAAVAVPTV